MTSVRKYKDVSRIPANVSNPSKAYLAFVKRRPLASETSKQVATYSLGYLDVQYEEQNNPSSFGKIWGAHPPPKLFFPVLYFWENDRAVAVKREVLISTANRLRHLDLQLDCAVHALQRFCDRKADRRWFQKDPAAPLKLLSQLQFEHAGLVGIRVMIHNLLEHLAACEAQGNVPAPWRQTVHKFTSDGLRLDVPDIRPGWPMSTPSLDNTPLSRCRIIASPVNLFQRGKEQVGANGALSDVSELQTGPYLQHKLQLLQDASSMIGVQLVGADQGVLAVPAECKIPPQVGPPPYST